MAVIDWPGLKVKRMPWGQKRNDVSFNSSFGSQSTELAVPQWTATLVSTPELESESGDWKAIGLKLKGKTEQLALWDIARPVPRGTMRGTMTFNTDAPQGETTLSIVASGQSGKTLLRGDYLGFGTLLTQQVVMVVEPATSDGSGVISVTVEPFLRNAFVAGDSVTWNMPKALFRRVDSHFGWEYAAATADGFVLDLVEDWRP